MSIASLLESKITSIPTPVVGQTLISNYIQSESGLIASTNDNINNIKNYYIDQYNKYILDNVPIGIIGNTSYKFNALIAPITSSTKYYSDIICQSGINKSPPEKIDYRTYLNEPRDQGQHGTCIAFTSSAILEFYLKLYGEYENYVSPTYIYAHRIKISQEGMDPRNALSIISTFGSIQESELPYSNFTTNQNGTGITPKMNLDAKKYINTNSNAKITTVNDLKISLANNGPCILCLPVFLDASGYTVIPNFWKAGTGNGDPKTSIGCHGVCVVGYDSTSFLLRNSWGTSVGNGGYFNFPFSDWGSQLDCYTPIPKKPLPSDIIYVYSPKESISESWDKNWLYFLLIIPIGWIIICIYYMNISENKYTNLESE